MLVGFVFVLSMVHWTEQHLLFPINFCHMAAACVHDNRLVCASTPDGCSRRTFLDQCDMYEFNCDYGTRYTDTDMISCKETEYQLCQGYQETYILYCISSNLEVLTENKETASSIKTTLKEIAPRSNAQEVDSDSDYLEAESPATVPATTKPQVLTTKETTWTTSRLIECIKPKPCPAIPSREPCPVCPTIEITTTRTPTIPVTASRATTILTTTVEPTIKTTLIPPVTTTTVSTTTTKHITTTTKTTSTTTTKTTKPSPCCDRPDTWSTTTEMIIPYFLPNQPIEYNEIIVETTKRTDPPTRHTTTPTPWTTKPSTTSTTTTTTKTTKPTPCCDRPDTWSTTTEKIFTYLFPNQPIEYNEIIVETTKRTDPPTTHTTTPTTTTKTTMKPTRITSRLTTITNSPITTTSMPTTTTVKASTETNSCCDRPGSWTATTEDNKPYSFPFESVNRRTQIISSSTTTDFTSSFTTTEKPMKPATIPKMRTVEPTPKIVEPTQTTAKKTFNTKLILHISKTTSPPVVIWSTTQTAMIIPETITENKPCCDRPATWSTTTEKVVPYVVQEKSASLEDNEIVDDPPLIDIPFDIPSEMDVPPESSPATEPPSPSTTEPPSPSTTEPPSPSTTEPPSPSTTVPPSPTTTEPPPPTYSGSYEVNVPQKLILLTDSEEMEHSPPKIVFLKSEKTKRIPLTQTTWWYPKMCPGSRCERPQVWSTTRSRRTRRWNEAYFETLGGFGCEGLTTETPTAQKPENDKPDQITEPETLKLVQKSDDSDYSKEVGGKILILHPVPPVFTPSYPKSMSTMPDKNGHKCENPYCRGTWMTTVKGETRDFFRILNDAEHEIQHEIQPDDKKIQTMSPYLQTTPSSQEEHDLSILEDIFFESSKEYME